MKSISLVLVACFLAAFHSVEAVDHSVGKVRGAGLSNREAGALPNSRGAPRRLPGSKSGDDDDTSKSKPGSKGDDDDDSSKGGSKGGDDDDSSKGGSKGSKGDDDDSSKGGSKGGSRD